MRKLLLLSYLSSIFIFAYGGHRHEREYSLCEDDLGNWIAHKEVPNFNENHHHCHKHLAKVHYVNDINNTGWAYLELEIKDGSLEHYKQGYIAGYLEGKATRDLIALQIRNTLSDYCYGAEKYCENLRSFLQENMKWMLKELLHGRENSYWKQVSLTLFQLQGIHDAYYHKKPQATMNRDFNFDGILDNYIDPILLLQLAGDLEDLQGKFKKPDNPRRPYSIFGGHCSALVKLLPDHSDLYFSHVTWSSYSSMLRMQKKYKFMTGDPGQEYAFSGYPGTIASVDDFVVTSSKLAVLETTIGNYNEELNAYIKPNTVLCWIRTQIAHRLSSTAAEWANNFGKHNSGTYNNEWVVVDYKRFKKGRHHQRDHGLIQVIEQLPHYIVHADMTKELLDASYFPSYNSPYFPQIQRESNTQKMIDKFGDWFTYDKTPRALIFARDHDKVEDMDSMIKLMRSNDYTHDPLARCNCTPPYSAENAIACRSELNPKNGSYPFGSLGFRDHGATDVKVTNSHLINSLQFTAIAGPTHDPTPVFDWDNSPFDNTVPHFGQPTRWTFGPVTHRWRKHSQLGKFYYNITF